MDTSRLKKFAQYARRSLLEQIESKLHLVSADESEARRESPKAIAELERKLKELGREQLIEQVAYTWFNRLCALRFMDVNQYNRIMVISPLPGQFQPEILAEAKAGHIDESTVSASVRETIFGLLGGSIASRDRQTEAFRLLIVAVCNDLNAVMPYLFERIEDFTELLMPEDLLSGNSILAYTREAMTPEACDSVESIGWLYQFYISEKKDEVFAGLKKNQKITAEKIPAATQLFTPHYIVRYLVENSLGRLWMLNNPDSTLIDDMEYYIKPVKTETDFLKISSPEEIKICDPACGSGHMLTYAYDLLYAIYQEAHYDVSQIPEKILTHNLYGIEIDNRAAELAAFALTMKAIKGNPKDESNNRRRFFRNPIQPNICRLENISLDANVLSRYSALFDDNLFSDDVVKTANQFCEADNFGSLIVPNSQDVNPVIDAMKLLSDRSSLKIGHPNVLSKDEQVLVLAENFRIIQKALNQANYLSRKYHVVVANPPYMGASNSNARLKNWLAKNFSNSKRDLFSAFIERNLTLSRRSGYVAMITMQNWMFISRFQAFRHMLHERSHLVSMAHLGERAFDSIGGEVVSTTAFVMSASSNSEYTADFIRLTEGKSEMEKAASLRDVATKTTHNLRYSACENDFKKIPGDPLAYWVSSELRRVFATAPDFDSILEAREGLTTGKNEDYVRYSFEVSSSRVCRGVAARDAAKNTGAKWFPYNKGGEKRKWFGNDEFIVNWENDGLQLQTREHPSGNRIWAHNFNLDFIFRPSISWSDITTKGLSARIFPEGFIFDATGLSAFTRDEGDFRWLAAAICNSHVGSYIASILNPTMHFKAGDFAKFPLVIAERRRAEKIARDAVDKSRTDWDAYETSWDFTAMPLIYQDHHSETLDACYARLRTHWRSITEEVQWLEEENNRIFIEAYGLHNELTPEVPLNEITLTCNPVNSIKGNMGEDIREAKLKARTMEEFLSYAVGCMFGRYSPDTPGLILANQGDGIAEFRAKVPESTFEPNEDNAIPMINFEGDWFEDDISERFKQFLRVTFGEDNFAVNLGFIEGALGGDGAGKDIKKFFLKDFYADHVKRYKKRPIYWLFSSPNGTFNVLIYMHRYRADTASMVLNSYLREFHAKLEARKESLVQVEVSASASSTDKKNAINRIRKIDQVLVEIMDYEHDTLYPLAAEKKEIDLDDGVKHNYPLFGKALKKVPGLS